MKRQTSILFLFCAVWIGLFIVSSGYAQQTDKETEYKIKAAFLLNFSKFISWPDHSFSENNPIFKICVLGTDPFGPALSAIKSRSVQNKKIELYQVDNVQQARVCQLLFISRSEENRINMITSALATESIATVSDIENFSRSGGIIEFVTIHNKLAFIINLNRARSQDLKVDASLLHLALEVLQ